jgi:ribonuclease HII
LGSTTFIVPPFSVMKIRPLPGSSEIAQPSLNVSVPTCAILNGGSLAGFCALSPDCALPQLAIARAQSDRAKVGNLMDMLSGSPSSDFCAGWAPELLVAGVDEAGRGPLAGPVVAAAVVLCKPRPAGIDDSKKLTPDRRAVADERIRRRCAYGIGVVEVEDIDRLNIFGATMLAMTLAMQRLCEALGIDCSEALVDGNLTPHGRTQGWRWKARPIVGGDALEPAISAASIVAKEHRDRLMREYHLAHPQYNWASNKGYSTPDHLAALRAHGPCPLHRRSFAPVAQADLFAA